MDIKDADYLIEKLGLIPHPEGGFYREVFKAGATMPESKTGQFPAGRKRYSSIYYLLKKGQFSAFHRLRSDEIWHHYAGGEVEIVMIKQKGLEKMTLGGNTGTGASSFQVLVPAGTWFTASLSKAADFALCGCTMSPGFDFKDFELGKSSELAQLVARQADKQFVVERCLL